MKKVLLIDDSRLFRKIAAEILSELPDVEVQEAMNGQTGLALIQEWRPDLVVLDVEMPVMDGLETLRQIKKLGLTVPVIMQSSLTQAGAEITLQALELGALDFISKPIDGQDPALMREALLERARAFLGFDQVREVRHETRRQSRALRYDVVVIGASTGGPQALQRIFQQLPADFPLPILIVQHMPPLFTKAFAGRLNTLSALTVVEAAPGMVLAPGQVYLAPGGYHLAVKGSAAHCELGVSDAPPLNSHRPSIDFTMFDLVQVFGGRIMAVMMTGMGRDGVEGTAMIYGAGGLTIAQNEASSVIYGMNKRAVEAGVVDQVLDLADISTELKKHCA